MTTKGVVQNAVTLFIVVAPPNWEIAHIAEIPNETKDVHGIRFSRVTKTLR